MFPFLDVGRILIISLPAAFLNPIFWAVLGLTFLQYSRVAKLEARVFGCPKETVLKRLLSSFLYGMVGGLIGSYILIFIGVAISPQDIVYLWPVALLLMLVDSRFMCFSYSAGVLGILHLIKGAPPLAVPQIMAFIAVLHMVEGILVYLNGAQGAIPVVMEGDGGTLHGGFLLQRFWPMSMLLILAIMAGMENSGGILWAPQWPKWWPLIESEPWAPFGSPVEYWLLPIPVAIGYTSIAIRRYPRDKARGSAMGLLVYSLILLALALLSHGSRSFKFAAIIFAPLGHEFLIWLSKMREERGTPLFLPSRHGLMILDVLHGSIGQRMGLEPGDLVKKVNQVPIRSIRDFKASNGGSPFYLEMEIERSNGDRQVSVFRGTWADLGVFFLPEHMEEGLITIEPRKGFLYKSQK